MTPNARDHGPDAPRPHDAFVQEAQKAPASVPREYLELLRTSKKWWLAPIVLALLLVGLVVVLSGTAVAPLIYTLF